MGDGFVILCDWDDLIIHLSLVNHAHHSYNFGLDKAQWLHANTTQNQNVKRIVILTVGLGNKTIVGRVVYRTEENTIQFEQATLLVQFVFDFAISWNLDDSIDNFRSIFSVGDVVPRVFSKMLLTLTSCRFHEYNNDMYWVALISKQALMHKQLIFRSALKRIKFNLS